MSPKHKVWTKNKVSNKSRQTYILKSSTIKINIFSDTSNLKVLTKQYFVNILYIVGGSKNKNYTFT